MSDPTISDTTPDDRKEIPSPITNQEATTWAQRPRTGRKPRTFRRRALLAAGGVTALTAATVGAWAGAVGIAYSQADRSTVGEMTFANPVVIPPVLDGTEQADGTFRYDLTLQAGTSSILPGKTTETWGANGPLLAPTLRARLGQTVRVAVRNDLPEATSIHWHGMHLPAAMDGGPHQAIRPGEAWAPVWAIDQPAATLWYHPHPHGATARHVYRGITGLFLLEDDASSAAGLPSRYGVDDIPLIIQDRLFADDGQFQDSDGLLRSISVQTGPGLLGDTILVNGTHDSHLDVTTTLVRLRLLNGSSTRSYHLGLSDDRPFSLVATENGLLDRPVALDRLPLSPGERAEIVVPFTAGETVVLRSYQPELGGNALSNRFWGGDDTFDLIQFRAGPDLEVSALLPVALPFASASDVIPVPDGSHTRLIAFAGDNELDGERMSMTRIDQVVPAGATEIWTVTGSGAMHGFHIHGASFRVLDIDGDPPPPHLVGLKDTVFIPDGASLRLAIRFPDTVDPAVPYMYHCHLLAHEDNGMMGQYLVVPPGTEARTPMTLPADLHASH